MIVMHPFSELNRYTDVVVGVKNTVKSCRRKPSSRHSGARAGYVNGARDVRPSADFALDTHASGTECARWILMHSRLVIVFEVCQGILLTAIISARKMVVDSLAS